VRVLVEDEVDRLGVYAPRQRGVEPASTNRSSHHSFVLEYRIRVVRVQVLTGLCVYAVVGCVPIVVRWSVVRFRGLVLRRPERWG
jgi:hypothetical protein